MRSSVQIFLAWIIAIPAFSTDWERFRGPNGSGVVESRNLPVEFGAEKNLRWRVPVPPGHSSPILVGDRVFLTAFEGAKLLTMSLDRARYPSVSNKPSIDVSSRVSRPSIAATLFPMWRTAPACPVTNQPPNRRSRGSL